MDKHLDESVARLRRRVLGMLKVKVLWVLICFGMLAFGAAVNILDPVKPTPRTPELIAAEQAELTSALRERRNPNLDQFQPFDNYHVTNYLVPLFGIWILCKVARRRGRLPVSVLATVAGLGFALSWSWPSFEALADVYWAILDFLENRPRAGAGHINGAPVLSLGAIYIGVALLLGILWMWWTPRLFDRVLRGPQPPAAAGRHPPAAGSTAWARIGLIVTVASIGPALWWLYDWIDGGSIPGPFALTVRGLFVVWALWLMTSAQIGLAWPGVELPRQDTGFEHDPEYNEYLLGG